jgi:hypothetical protein
VTPTDPGSGCDIKYFERANGSHRDRRGLGRDRDEERSGSGWQILRQATGAKLT